MFFNSTLYMVQGIKENMLPVMKHNFLQKTRINLLPFNGVFYYYQ